MGRRSFRSGVGRVAPIGLRHIVRHKGRIVWDAMLRFRMGEEKWSVSSLTNYKMVRSMAWLYHNTKDAVNEFSKKYNCDLALAEEYLKVVRGIRNQQPFYVTDEDGEETGDRKSVV